MLPTQCLCTKLRRASRGVTRFYDDALAPVGLNAAQFSLLRNLQRLGQPSITGLAEAMGLDRSTLGRNLKVVQGMGLVELGDGSDQRSRQVALNEAGLLVLEQGAPLWEQAQQALARRLGADKRAALMLLLDDLETID
ncbi:MarR family winged helix-turn-helix transcriptional regulator [Pseudomonas sp. BMS12]|uniref:MarR family winged helix-turn-helix transcriptional regulator n=1 Tax=Pseudomonas sp. BMS12 TaxID=1796033 RepID=UPI000839E085|nr:MarR family winged helix-turn-helix transcriptional regulator [Pseudomonas sp. BMS12]